MAEKDAIAFGLLPENCRTPNDIFKCHVKEFAPKSEETKRKSKMIHNAKASLVRLMSLSLKDYSKELNRSTLNENSPYVVVPYGTGKQKIVRKTSLCWLLREEHIKISSDRLMRVRAPISKVKTAKTKHHRRFVLKA